MAFEFVRCTKEANHIANNYFPGHLAKTSNEKKLISAPRLKQGQRARISQLLVLLWTTLLLLTVLSNSYWGSGGLTRSSGFADYTLVHGEA